MSDSVDKALSRAMQKEGAAVQREIERRLKKEHPDLKLSDLTTDERKAFAIRMIEEIAEETGLIR